MMNYDSLLDLAAQAGITVKEKPLSTYDGRIKNKTIYLRQDMTTTEKACVLAEELGHYYTSVGNILDQGNVGNRRQEYRARLWGYELMIGLSGIIHAYQAGCQNLYAMADALNVTEQYLEEALICYRKKYGVCTTYDGYTIFFLPTLAIYRMDIPPRIELPAEPLPPAPAAKPEEAPAATPKHRCKRRRLSKLAKYEKERLEFLEQIGRLPEPQYLLDENVVLENHMVSDNDV